MKTTRSLTPSPSGKVLTAPIFPFLRGRRRVLQAHKMGGILNGS